MGIIEDVKADLLDGIRLAERLVEAIAGSPAEGGIESDDVAGCPFEDVDPDSGVNECAEAPAVSKVVVVEGPSFQLGNHTRSTFTADGWVAESDGSLALYQGNNPVAVFADRHWTSAWFTGS